MSYPLERHANSPKTGLMWRCPIKQSPEPLFAVDVARSNCIGRGPGVLINSDIKIDRSTRDFVKGWQPRSRQVNVGIRYDFDGSELPKKINSYGIDAFLITEDVMERIPDVGIDWRLSLELLDHLAHAHKAISDPSQHQTLPAAFATASELVGSRNANRFSVHANGVRNGRADAAAGRRHSVSNRELVGLVLAASMQGCV